MPRPIRLAAFPRDDTAFRAHVEAAIARLGPDCTSREVQAEIRVAYPAAVVRAQSAMAAVGFGSTWYAYRDGRVIVGTEAEGSWWEDPALPRTVVDRAGRYVEANEAAAALFGVTREQVLAGRAGDFTRHETDPEVGRRLFEELERSGTLDSTAVVVRPDGSECPIEFHMIRNPDRHDRYITVMRLSDDGETISHAERVSTPAQ